MRLADQGDALWMGRFENRLLYELYVAYLEARRGGKRGTFDEHKFEVNEFENLVNLRDSLLDKTYRPSRGTAHIIRNPVIREIFAASFRDRVVHHLMYDIVYDWWDRRFIYDSYSCREGKGTLFGVNRLASHIQSASQNFTREVYVVKMDIQGYFMSLPRKKLYERAMWWLNKQFEGNYGRKYELMRFLWEQTIFDDPCKGVRKKGWPGDWVDLPDSKSLFKQRPGTGMVIGNLTSQLLSNAYLDQLDRYIVFDLGWKHYGRYVDDFYVVVTAEELPKVMKDVKLIRNFLARLELTMHPHKFSIQPADRGVDFLGGVVYPGRKYPGQRIIRNAGRAFNETVEGVRDVESVVSYLGHMKNFSHEKIVAKLFERAGWDYRFAKS